MNARYTKIQVNGPLSAEALKGKDPKDYKIVSSFAEKEKIEDEKKDAAKTALPSRSINANSSILQE